VPVLPQGYQCRILGLFSRRQGDPHHHPEEEEL